MPRYESRAVPLDDRDRERLASIRKTNQATIGKLLMRKERFVGRIKVLTDAAKLLVDRCTHDLAEGVQLMDCRVDLDFHHGQARYVREDTGEVVYSRPLTADERQAVLPLESEPAEGPAARGPFNREQIQNLVNRYGADVTDKILRDIRGGVTMADAVEAAAADLEKTKKGGKKKPRDLGAP